jgi:hypothetical protein
MDRSQNQDYMNAIRSKNGYLKIFGNLGFFWDFGIKIPGILFKSTQTIYKRGQKKVRKNEKVRLKKKFNHKHFDMNNST